MKSTFFYISICLLISSCHPKFDTPITISIDENWQFKKVGDTIWYPASVPGNVHSDLLSNDLIAHPFYKDNELSLQWISETNWEYRTNFKLTDQLLNKKVLELDFEGLDTYASVFLNDSLILSTNNAFRKFTVQAKSLLKSENELRILFEKTSLTEAKEKSKLNYTLPEGSRIFTRKAQFQYGWDWGPKLNTSGIWRPITLIANNDLRIRDAYIHQFELNDSVAKMYCQMDLAHNKTDGYTFQLFVNDSLVTESNEGFQYNPIQIPFQIEDPKLWWPHNIGEPYLYDIKVVVKDKQRILDSISLKKGIRDIQLVNERDSIGESFYFKINGTPVYAKGANYIPQNSMQDKVTRAHYEELLESVVMANMNMLRVWGGGIYENDIFYELCDELGILVWQDFMFACAMYPGDNKFLENVEQEAIDNVKRLRNHACMALWCGNNENSEGWHRWGWQAGRSVSEQEEIWSNYLKLFDSILPKVVSQFSDHDYWETSPKFGRGDSRYITEGDAHDWWVWHDAYPFEHYEDHVPRFMSEFGFQSYPGFEVIKYINQSDSVDIFAAEFQSHQKHSRGFQLINDYMKMYYPVPQSDEDYVYVSQLLQALGITMGIEAQRRSKPYCMGSLYWQLNDCWPVVSWSSIDHFGQWKALHYHAKNSFENLLISSRVKNDTLKTYLVNDHLEPHSGALNIKIMDFYGTVVYSDSKQVRLSGNTSEVVHQLELQNVDINKDKVVVLTEFNDQRSFHYLTRPKGLKLPMAEIRTEVSQTADGFQIELFSEVLQKDVFIDCNENGHFSDNYFDLLPNESRTIRFYSKSKSLGNLKIKTLNSLLTRP